ncbi:MAG: hypothetical protein WCD79_03175 [Chthoniobacteraceae bacterium]
MRYNIPPLSLSRNVCILSLLFLLSLAGFQRAEAALPQLAPGERIQFFDDFNDNSNNWTNIGTGSGKGSIGTDPGGSGATVWCPSANADGASVTSVLTLPHAVDLANGPVSVYMRVRTDGTNIGGLGSFDFRFSEQSPDKSLGEQYIEPGSASMIEYTESSGTTGGTTGSTYTFSGTNFVDFRLVFTSTGPGTVSLQSYYYNTTTSSYTSLGTVSPAYITSGVFNTLWVYSRNGAGGGRAYFDSIMIAQGNRPGENYLFGDDFSAGLLPDWRFIDTGTAGEVWSPTTDDTSPMSYGVLTNKQPTTQAVVQWDPVTLSSTGDYMVLYMTVRTPSVNTSGSFQTSLLSTSSILDVNAFGSGTSYPLANANGYTCAQSYNSTSIDLQRVINNAPSDLSIQSGTSVVGDSKAHSLILKAMLTSSGGIQYSATVDSTTVTTTDTSPSTLTFDTLRIDGAGYPVNIDNVQVCTTRPTDLFSFSLPHSYVTSAGVFNSQNQLVRNLWKKEAFPPGNYTRSWGGVNDAGTPLTSGSYTVKVLYHNMNYVFDGVVGTTARNPYGCIYQSLDTFRNLVITNSGTGLISVGYGEGAPNILGFTNADPQSPFNGWPVVESVLYNRMATDGVNYYLANRSTGWDTWNNTYVVASPAFTGGTTGTLSGVTPVTHVIDLASEVILSGTPASPYVVDKPFTWLNQATGLAVQRSGTLLAVSHGGTDQRGNSLNEVRLFNKTSGVSSGTISGVAGAGELAFSPNGNLWVISGSAASVYCYSGLPGSPVITGTISGLSNPIAVAVSPTSDDVVLVADGGTSQQVKFYDHTGAPVGSPLGLAGGYQVNGPAAATNKFWFLNYRESGTAGSPGVPASGITESTFISFDPTDNSFWVGDEANERALHFGSDHTYKGQISMVSGGNYNLAVDPNNPGHVYSNNLEYDVDYTKTLTGGDPDTTLGGNGCWKLANNWNAMFPHFLDYGSFVNVTTLAANGRTYAQIEHNVAPLGRFVGELTSSGSVRLTSTNSLFATGNYHLYDNGDIRYATTTSGSTNPHLQTIYRQTLNSGAGINPTWSSGTAIGSLLYNTGTAGNKLDPCVQAGWSMGTNIPITSSNTIVCFQAGNSSYLSSGTTGYRMSDPDFHLGGVMLGGTNFLFESSPGYLENAPDGLGTFPEYPGYGAHDGIAVYATGRDIVYGYDGQYSNWGNQYMHYYDDGLFVGQFGVTHPQSRALDTTGAFVSAPGGGGNIADMLMVASSGTSYVYLCSEAGLGGIYRWRLDGTVNEISTTGTLNSSGVWSGTGNLGSALAWSGTNLVINPGFEAEASTYNLSGTAALNYPVIPAGWQVASGGNGVRAFYTAWMEVTGGTNTKLFAQSLPYHATIASSGTYHVTPFQILNPLASGTYRMTASVASSGSQSLARMYFKKVPLSGTFDQTANITASGTWTTVTIDPIVVTGDQGEIGFDVSGSPGQYIYIDNVVFSHY